MKKTYLIPAEILDALNFIESYFPDVSVSDEQMAEYFSDVRYAFYNDLYPAIVNYFVERVETTNPNDTI